MTTLTSPRFWTGFIATLVLFFIGDTVWHNVLLKEFYGTRLAAIGGTLPTGFPPLLVLLEVMGAVGMVYFVLATWNKKNPLWTAAWTAGFIGFLMIGSVNFLNHTLLPQWDLALVIVDTLWGTALSALCGLAVGMLVRKKM